MTVPYDIPSREMLLALINEDNNTNIPMDALEFDLPQVRFGSYNTRVLVRPRSGSNLQGNRPVNYNRLDIEIFLETNPKVYSNDVRTTYDLAKEINAQYNLNIGEDDIVNEPVVGSVHILRMHDNSYTWIGDVLVRIIPSDRPLHTVIASSRLGGLAYPL